MVPFIQRPIPSLLVGLRARLGRFREKLVIREWSESEADRC
jgi:hypothetical protein